MAKPKEERNRQFQEDWQKGLGNEDLGKKYGLSLGGVKALKQRLRAKDPSLYVERRPELTKVEREGIKEVGKRLGKVVKVQVGKSPHVDKSISPLVHKRATYYLTPEIIKKVKLAAVERNIDASGIVREALSKWISEQVDK